MDVATVRHLAREHRVVPHPTRYHAGRHGIGFVECVAALERCYAVSADDRRAGSWYALADHTYGRRLRVEFDVHADEDGGLLLVVTAYTSDRHGRNDAECTPMASARPRDAPTPDGGPPPRLA